ncbi:MAG: BON domain-containing protein [Chloroflexi bacterium]|nr:BON domain-containing protein [Chloroflexota bacterium]
MWGPHFPPSSALSRQWMYSHLHIEDERLGEIVGSAIANDPMIPPQANIDVEVSDGVITLTGTVPNKLVKHAAGDDAWYTPGVWDVHNNLEVVALHKARRRTARRAEH